MAATDQTYRKLKTVHVVFGVSCLLMLFSTIWMFVQDYNREWKPIQRQFRDVEDQRNLRMMLEQLPRGEELQDKITAAESARKAYAQAQADIRGVEKQRTADREIKNVEFQTITASFNSVSSLYDGAVEAASKDTDPRRTEIHQKDVAHLFKEREKLRDELAKAQSALDLADYNLREDVTLKLSDQKAALEKAEDDLKRITGPFDRFAKATALKRWTAGDSFRTLPIVDGFASPTKINQIVLNDLPIDYSFKLVPRYDRCTTCHLGIDRGMFDKAALDGLTKSQPELEKSLTLAKRLLIERKNKGEDLGFDPSDLPSRPQIMALTKSEITQFAAHPRLDLFVDSNSPHGAEKFGCTICHQGQGSSTSFVLASHTPANAQQTEEWKKNHDWASIHDWDFPMYSTRFIESSCLQCHHQVTDLIRHGSKEEAPKLLKGYNLVKENGCFGCHEISGIKSGRSVGPDLRLESTPALELLSAGDQDKAKADALNPPGTMRKVGPSLRRVAEKTNEEWARKWIQAPRAFREDTKMPHFYGLSTNTAEALPDDQKKFPDAEIHAIAHYLFLESNDFLKANDTYRRTLIAAIESLYSLYQPDPDHKRLNDKTAKETENYKELEEKRAAKKLTEIKKIEQWAALDRKVRGGPLAEKERKELLEITRNFANLALLSAPTHAGEINSIYAELKGNQDRLQELKAQEDDLRRKNPPEVMDDEGLKSLKDVSDKVDKTTKRLIALAKPVRIIGDKDVKGQVVDVEGKAVPQDTLMKGDGDNGKKLFIEKGCMACHSHNGTEPSVVGEANFGPNLSRVAAKLSTEGGTEETKRRWLVQWLLNPTIHNPRTRMPITFLKAQDASDIASWLLGQEVKDYRETDPLSPSHQTIVDMARVYLAKAPGMTAADVEKYLPRSKAEEELPPGIPDEQREFMTRDADELALIGTKDKTLTRDKLLWYVGKKSISRLGCYGCHDVPGFESAKPIGTALNDWGKKDPERLAFEDSAAFVEHHYNIVESRDDPKDKTKANSNWKEKDNKEPYEKYFADAVEHHHRDGFLHLKLMEPRSFDYKRIRTWDDRLRMPQFQFSRPRPPHFDKDDTDATKKQKLDDFEIRRTREEAEAREAVMTFVLGLLAEPIPLKYVNQPVAEKAAEVRGRQVIDKFNCAGCHQIRSGFYEFKPSTEREYGSLAFLEKAYGRVTNNDGLKSDHYFPMHNAWDGTPSPYADRIQVFGVEPKSNDLVRSENRDVSDKVLNVRLTDALRFTNNEKVLRNIPASSTVQIPEKDMLSRSDPWGGSLVHLLVGPPDPDDAKIYTGYVAKQLKGNGDDTKGRLPPPLIREGERVQTTWLYQFLLNPTPIRPESYMKLRMPRFNMSQEEAQAIVNYFAASSKTGNPGAGLTYPYETIPQRDKHYWAMRSEDYSAANKDDTTVEMRSKALLKDLETQVVDLTKAEKKAEAAALEPQIKKLKDEIDKKNWTDLRKEWLTPDVYEKDAYKLLTNRNMCLKCHSIGDIKVEGATGPPLDLTAARLRPEWTREWISNPVRLFPYNPQMPQNFANDERDKQTGISKQWLDSFYGPPREQAQAVRDALMALPNLSEMRKPAGGK